MNPYRHQRDAGTGGERRKAIPFTRGMTMSNDPHLNLLLASAEAVVARANREGRDLTPAEAAEIDDMAARFWAASGVDPDSLPEPAPQPRRFAAPANDPIASRSDLETRLRNAGLSRAAAKKVAAGGWPALDPDRARADLLTSIKAATARLSPRN